MDWTEIINEFKISNTISYRLNAPCDFYFPPKIINTLQDNVDQNFEKGGIVRFSYSKLNEIVRFVATNIDFITNRSDSPESSYLPDNAELNISFKNAIDNNEIPFEFHTHPTIYSEYDDVIDEGEHYLEQLNTSIEDQFCTLSSKLKYKNYDLRTPDILIVYNVSSLFIGFYGGLVAPMCFTERKKVASREGARRIFSEINNWADTPERKGLLIFSACALAILGIRYYKVTLPLLIAAKVAVPPVVYSMQERNDFFGISFGMDLTVHIPRIEDAEILRNEEKAIEVRNIALKNKKKK